MFLSADGEFVRFRLSLASVQNGFGITQGPGLENISKCKPKKLSQGETINCTGELTAMLSRNATQ
jgi:hypothetical protein